MIRPINSFLSLAFDCCSTMTLAMTAFRRLPNSPDVYWWQSWGLLPTRPIRFHVNYVMNYCEDKPDRHLTRAIRGFFRQWFFGDFTMTFTMMSFTNLLNYFYVFKWLVWWLLHVSFRGLQWIHVLNHVDEGADWSMIRPINSFPTVAIYLLQPRHLSNGCFR